MQAMHDAELENWHDYEVQSRREIVSLLRQMMEQGCRTVEVRREVYDRYAEAVDSAHRRMIWQASGVKSYFMNSRGRNVVNNPFRIIDFWKMTESANLGDYRCLKPTGASVPIAAEARA